MIKGQHPSPLALSRMQRAAKNRKSSGQRSPIILGMIFGMLTVVQREPNSRKCASRWLCRCECGREKIIYGSMLLLGQHKSCGCNRTDRLKLRPYEALYRTFVYKRRNEDRLNTLTYEEFLEFTKQETCHYCNAPIRWSKFNTVKNGHNYNLDRKDNLLGYTVENCVVCCTRCNVGKNRFFSYEQWLELGNVIRGWNK